MPTKNMTKKIIEKNFIETVSNSSSIQQVLIKLGCSLSGGAYKFFYRKVKEFNLDTSHFVGKAHLKNKTHNWSKVICLDDILIKDSTYSNSHCLKKRLVKSNLLDYKCSVCNISSWNEKELSLHLDHVDGNNMNNELSNLRLLCPNCHSQTPTYCGKNKGKYKNIGTGQGS